MDIYIKHLLVHMHIKGVSTLKTYTYVHAGKGFYIKDTLEPQFLLSLQRLSQFEGHFLPYRVILGLELSFLLLDFFYLEVCHIQVPLFT